MTERQLLMLDLPVEPMPLEPREYHAYLEQYTQVCKRCGLVEAHPVHQPVKETR